MRTKISAPGVLRKNSPIADFGPIVQNFIGMRHEEATNSAHVDGQRKDYNLLQNHTSEQPAQAFTTRRLRTMSDLEGHI